MNMATKQEIWREHLTAYCAGGKEEKGRILDAVCRVSGMDRKAAIRRFAVLARRPSWWSDTRGGKVVYGTGVTAALKDVWEIASRICAERLHGCALEYVRILQRDGMWKHGTEVTRLLSLMSLGTMKNRICAFENERGRHGRGTTKPSGLKEIIPIRRGPWENPPPGKGEIDTVAHCGETVAGDFCYTVQYTDVAVIWTCLSGQWNKGEIATRESIERIKRRLPFGLRGIDPDSGSEFINWHLKSWCDAHAIEMTRTRPYMKNDHARIEQKNYTNVRKFVGYARLNDSRCVKTLNELYDVLEDYINFFIPSVKCVGKERTGSRTKRLYDKPQTAYERVLAHPAIAKGIKDALRKKYETLNPKTLKEKIGRLQGKLHRA
ncbi:MAG: hypothetical protein Q8P19_04145 [bacterium]|nr:hypothetical protein [bacterium]